jgi:exonuclease SbcC
MIKLERLHVEGFKRLSGIDLSYPSRCCVLIEGQNEAGKSTLFESIYYALYGDALVKRGGGRGRIDSAIRHGLSEAFVALTMSVGDTQLKIQRSIFRHRTNSAQLLITYPGRDPETVSGTRAVNARIIQELNGLDGEALLNSCFVEQKQLDKLEGSSRAKREEVLLKLLDMDRLTDLGNAFKWGGGDDRQLDIARDKLQLVQAARKLTEAQELQAQVKRQLKLVAIHIDLDEIEQQREIVQKQSAEQEQQEAKVRQLNKELACLGDLRSAETALVAIQDSLDTIANYEAEMRRLRDELDELDRLEREELPARRADLRILEIVQSHLDGIKGLEVARRQATVERERLESILSLADQLKEPKRRLEALPCEEKDAHNAARNAERRLKAAQTIEALQRWAAAYRAIEALADADGQIRHAQERAESVRERQETLDRERKSSKVIPVTVALLLIGLVVAGISLLFAPFWLIVPVGTGFSFNPLWLVAAALIVVGVAVGVRGLRQHRYIKAELVNCDNQLQEYKRAIGEQERRKETVTEQRPPTLETCVAQLEKLEVDVPRSEDEADTVIRTLEDGLGEYDMSTLIEAVSEAGSELSTLTERRRALEAEIVFVQGELDDSLADVNLRHIDAVKRQIEILRDNEAGNETEVRDKWEAISDELARFDLPRETESALNCLAGQVGRLTNEIEKLEERVRGREKLKQQQKEWKECISSEENNIQKQREELAELSEKVGDPITVPDNYVVTQVLADVRLALEQLDESQLKLDLKSAQEATADAKAAVKQAEEAITSAKANIEQILAQLDLPVPEELTLEAIAVLEPEFMNWSTTDYPELEGQHDNLIGTVRSLGDEVQKLETKLGVRHQELEEESCQCEVETLQQRKAVCHKAQPILEGVRRRMLSRVLPGTIDYMQLILPLLTAGRYCHAELDPDSYKMRAWDVHAGEQGEYVEKDFFSGGTQDQFSLALRLGFALAALPQELGVSPGFIFLDEPLSAFDRQRTAALIKLLSEGEVAKRFDQIFLIAHDRTFETCPFPYYVRLEDGRIVEHNLKG